LVADDQDVAVERRLINRREAAVVERRHIDAAHLEPDLRPQAADLDHWPSSRCVRRLASPRRAEVNTRIGIAGNARLRNGAAQWRHGGKPASFQTLRR